MSESTAKPGTQFTWTRPTLAGAYAAHGWAVFPLHSPTSDGRCDCRKECGRDAGKHPRTAHGLLDASTDLDVVTSWWTMWPSANIGIATGAGSGLVVLDVDFRHNGDVSLGALTERHDPLPETPCVYTGNGLHYYFAHPGHRVKSSVGKLGAGLDVRGDGGYVVAPPSVHISGRTYIWTATCDPAPLPAWLETQTRTDALEHGPPMETAAVLSGVPEGKRDDALFHLACKLRRADVPRDAAVQLVLQAAANCSPPFEPQAALRKVASAYDRYVPAASTVRKRKPIRNVM